MWCIKIYNIRAQCTCRCIRYNRVMFDFYYMHQSSPLHHHHYIIIITSSLQYIIIITSSPLHHHHYVITAIHTQLFTDTIQVMLISFLSHTWNLHRWPGNEEQVHTFIHVYIPVWGVGYIPGHRQHSVWLASEQNSLSASCFSPESCEEHSQWQTSTKLWDWRGKRNPNSLTKHTRGGLGNRERETRRKTWWGRERREK